MGILTATLDALADPVIVYDLNDRILFTNAAARGAMAPQSSGEYFERPLAGRAAALSPRTAAGEPLAEHDWPLRRAQRGEVLTGEHAVELRLTGADGVELWVSQSASPVRDATGALVGVVTVTRDITATHRAQQAEAERAADLSAIIETIPDAVAVYSADGRVLHANAAFNELFELERIAGFFAQSVEERRRLLDVRSSEDVPVHQDQSTYARVLRGETVKGATAVDVRIRRPTGEDVLLNVVGSPVRDASGRVSKAVMVYRDTTERRRIGMDHVRQRRELEAILDTVTDGVALFDAEGQLVRTNAAGMRLFGLGERRSEDAGQSSQVERAQLLGLRDEQGELFTEESWPLSRLLRGEALTGEHSFDVIRQHPDGREAYLNIEGVPMRDAEGQIVGAVAVARDVSERRRLERRTREALDALLEMAQALVSGESAPRKAGLQSLRVVARRLGELIRSVLDCERVAITAVEPGRGTTQVLAVIGLTPEQDAHLWANLPHESRLSDTVDPQSLARLRAGEVLTADLGEEGLDDPKNPYRARSVLVAPGLLRGQLLSVLTVDYGSKPHEYPISEQALAGAVAQLMTLVIERERLVRERAEARASALALQESNRRMDEFMSIVSHELKTPLTTIKANVQLARRRAARSVERAKQGGAGDGAESEVMHTLLTRTESAVNRQERLVNDLLDVSRIQTGKLVLRVESIDLAEVVRDVVEEQRLAAPSRVISLAAPEGPLRVWADADRIRQVITNYVNNAVKYSAEADAVSVRLAREDAVARLDVHDLGPGIPAEEHPHIWERFHRVAGIEHRSGSGVGLGLGLYISREIVELHGGAVGVESVLGAGSTFWFTLPLASE